MNFDFYSQLSRQERERYDLMLTTVYVLLRCDEWHFIQVDETDREYLCVSWLLSIQPTLDLFGLKPGLYPQGSISANFHYYNALRAYFGGNLPKTQEFSVLRQELLNFLMLRRDDSSANRSNFIWVLLQN